MVCKNWILNKTVFELAFPYFKKVGNFALFKFTLQILSPAVPEVVEDNYFRSVPNPFKLPVNFLSFVPESVVYQYVRFFASMCDVLFVNVEIQSRIKVDRESVRFRFRYFSQIQIWTLATSKSPVSSVKYQDENNNR